MSEPTKGPLEQTRRHSRPSAEEEYLTTEELAQRLKLKPRTIKNKMAAGVLRKGIHYVHPKGIRPRFKWSAIVAWLEETEQPAAEQPADVVPMARGYLLGERRQKKLGAAP
jgi:hypothetical protein